MYVGYTNNIVSRYLILVWLFCPSTNDSDVYEKSVDRIHLSIQSKLWESGS